MAALYALEEEYSLYLLPLILNGLELRQFGFESQARNEGLALFFILLVTLLFILILFWVLICIYLVFVQHQQCH